ncbi:Eae protein [Salmonella enterica subsp. enterica]|nr:Eae protein [Salmonella enterica subsp. enterica]
MQQVKIYTAPPSDLSPPVQSESFCVDMVLASDYAALEARYAALAAENAYLLNGAARELNTSWMFHKTMLGAQAALVCLSHGYQAAAREWLEGTTDEAGAEIPDDISVGELHEWFDRQMVSNDGKSGFLTRSEAEEAIRKACPATDVFLAEVRAQGADELAELYFTLAAHEANRYIADSWRESARFAKDHAAQLRKGAVL